MAIRKQKSRSRGDLLDAAWQVAQQHRAHHTYGSESSACKALEGRCKGFSERQYQNAFRQAVALYDAAVVLVDANARALWEQTDVAKNQYPAFTPLVSRLRQTCPGFRVATYLAALSWVFFWRHLK